MLNVGSVRAARRLAVPAQDRILRDHETSPPTPVEMFEAAAANIVALYRRIGSATLFDNAWRVLPADQHRRLWRGPGERSIVAIIDLADGRSVAVASDFGMDTPHWVVCRLETVPNGSTDPIDREFRLVEDPAEVPVYGTSLALLLDAALDSGGDITHLETGRLDQLDSLTP
ncbi:hypothetical protein BDK92_1291 [Micromonospora pisi]|uniref:Uncharacterized protein n=1 Tax=Micromonospora pisi TaxID=589240 RepID=A0A495JG28_9ACTN|nr:hypothetical protein [Micromonospora pisi]RKR87019.1 hypothetical protein BDK92_1291 [Micromonospora pisi]